MTDWVFATIYVIGFISTAVTTAVLWMREFGTGSGEMMSGGALGLLLGAFWPVTAVIVGIGVAGRTAVGVIGRR